MEIEHGESFVVRVALLLVRGLLHRNVPSRSELTARNKHLKAHLPSPFADECVQLEFRTVLPVEGGPPTPDRPVNTWSCSKPYKE